MKKKVLCFLLCPSNLCMPSSDKFVFFDSIRELGICRILVSTAKNLNLALGSLFAQFECSLFLSIFVLKGNDLVLWVDHISLPS